MKKLVGVTVLLLAQSVWSAPLTTEQFKQQTKAHYDDLEFKLADLNYAVDQKQHPSILIQKACRYSTALKGLKSFAQKNKHLTFAQEEYVFVSQLDDGFNQSLLDLGTTYEKGCTKK